MIRDRCCKGEIRARIKRGVYVNEVYLSCKLGKKRWQDVLLVPPHEPVAPLRVPPAREELKIPSSILCAFVDRLNSLKWQCNSHWRLFLVVLVFPVPNQFCHSSRLAIHSATNTHLRIGQSILL